MSAFLSVFNVSFYVFRIYFSLILFINNYLFLLICLFLKARARLSQKS